MVMLKVTDFIFLASQVATRTEHIKMLEIGIQIIRKDSYKWNSFFIGEEKNFRKTEKNKFASGICSF